MSAHTHTNADKATPASDRVINRAGGSTAAISARTNANLSRVQMTTREGIEDLMSGPRGAIGTSGHRYPSAPRDFLGA